MPLLIINQVLFLLFVTLSNSGRVCFVLRHFLFWLSVLSCHLHSFFSSFCWSVDYWLSRDFTFIFTTWTCQFSTWTIFFQVFFIIGNGLSLSHRWPRMDAMGSPWPSMGSVGMSWSSLNCIGVSARARSGPDSKPHRFHHNCEEMLLWKLRNLFSKIFLNNHEFLILHDVRKIHFL